LGDIAMAFRLNLFEKTYFAAVLIWEAFRFVFFELRSGHTGTYGLKGYQFMLNELLRGRYSGRRRHIVEAFTLMTSIRQADEKGIDIYNLSGPPQTPGASTLSAIAQTTNLRADLFQRNSAMSPNKSLQRSGTHKVLARGRAPSLHGRAINRAHLRHASPLSR
jgi:hypothetical protein